MKKVVLRIRDEKPEEETEVLDIWLERATNGGDWIDIRVNGHIIVCLKAGKNLVRASTHSSVFPVDSIGRIRINE